VIARSGDGHHQDIIIKQLSVIEQTVISPRRAWSHSYVDVLVPVQQASSLQSPEG
jgi:hypothetical protein